MHKFSMRAAVTLILSAMLVASVAGVAAAQYPPPFDAQNLSEVLEATVCTQTEDVIVCTTGVVPEGVVVEGCLTFGLTGDRTVEACDTEAGADEPVALAFGVPVDAVEVLGISLRAEGAEGTVVTAAPADAIAAVADLRAPDEAGLPTTGGQFTVGMALAITVLILGAGLLLAARRRSGADVGSEN